MSSFKTDSGIAECRKTEDGICDTGGGMGSGITSINGSTVSAQSIVGGTGINVSSLAGTTTIFNTGPGSGTVTSVSASVPTFQSVNVSTSTTTPSIAITLSGQPLNIVSTGNSTIESSQTNQNVGSSAESGYSVINDASDSLELVMSGSNNTRRGVIRTSSAAFGLDLNVQGGSKTIRLMTNSATRVTLNDSGMNGILGATTPANATINTLTLINPLTIANGGTSNITAQAAFDALAPAQVNKGGLIVWDGLNNAALVTSAANDGKVLTSDSGQAQGASWQTPASGTGTVSSVGTSSSVTALTLGGGPITTSGTVALSFSGTPFPISQGGTGATTKTPAFDALSPMTTGGDIIYGGSAGLGTRLGNGTAGQVLTSSGTTLAPTWQTVTGTGSVTSVDMTVPSVLSISGNPITSSGTLAVGYSGTALPILNGGTGQTTRSAAFNGLAPATPAKGTLVVNDGSNWVNLPVGTDTFLLTANSGATDGVSWNSASAVLNSVVGFSANTTSAQSIATSTAVKVTWDTIVFDTNSGWSVSDNWYVVPNTGYYFVSAQLAFASGFSAYDAELYIVKNNSTIVLKGDEYHPAISAVGTTTVTGLFSFASGDTVQIQCFQNSGGTILLNADATITNFMVASVGGVSTAGGSGTVTSVNATVPSLLSISGGPITTSGTLSFTYSGTPLPIANGGTAGTTAASGFNNLAPSTSTGGLILGTGSNAYGNLAIGTTGFVLTSNGTTAAWAAVTSGTVTSVSASVPAFLSVSVSNPTTTPAVTITLSGTALPLANGGTSATTSQGAINAISQLTTSGDLLYYNGSNSTRFPLSSTYNQVLTTLFPGVLAWTTPASGTVTSVGLNTSGGSTPATSLVISGSPNPITTSGTLSVNYSGVPQPILYGGTGATTATTAFNNLAPSTSTGGLIVGTGSNAYGNVGIGASGYVLTSSGTTAQWSPATAIASNPIYRITSGPYSMFNTSQTLLVGVSNASGPIAVTLPSATTCDGAIVNIKRTMVGSLTQANTLTPVNFSFSGSSTDAAPRINYYTEVITLVADAVNNYWWSLNRQYPRPWYISTSGLPYGSTSNPQPVQGTGGANVCNYRREGTNLQVSGYFSQNTAGSAGNGTYIFSLPLEISSDPWTVPSIDTSVLLTTGSNLGSPVGTCTLFTSSIGNRQLNGEVFVYDSSHVCMNLQPALVIVDGFDNLQGPFTYPWIRINDANYPFSLSGTYILQYNFSVPMTFWQS